MSTNFEPVIGKNYSKKLEQLGNKLLTTLVKAIG